MDRNKLVKGLVITAGALAAGFVFSASICGAVALAEVRGFDTSKNAEELKDISFQLQRADEKSQRNEGELKDLRTLMIELFRMSNQLREQVDSINERLEETTEIVEGLQEGLHNLDNWHLETRQELRELSESLKGLEVSLVNNDSLYTSHFQKLEKGIKAFGKAESSLDLVKRSLDSIKEKIKNNEENIKDFKKHAVGEVEKVRDLAIKTLVNVEECKKTIEVLEELSGENYIKVNKLENVFGEFEQIKGEVNANREDIKGNTRTILEVKEKVEVK